MRLQEGIQILNPPHSLRKLIEWKQAAKTWKFRVHDTSSLAEETN